MASAMISKFWKGYEIIRVGDHRWLQRVRKYIPWLILIVLICLLLWQSTDLVEQVKSTNATLEATQQSLAIDLYFSNIDCKDVKLVNVIDRKNRSIYKFDKHVFPEFNFHVANKYFLIGDYKQAETYYLKSLREFNNLTKEQLAHFYETNYTPEELAEVESQHIPNEINMDIDENLKLLYDPSVYKYRIYTNLYVNSLSLHSDDQKKQDEYHQNAVKFHDKYFKRCADDKLGISKQSK